MTLSLKVAEDMTSDLKIFSSVILFLSINLPMVVGTALDDCAILEDEGWINTSHYQFRPIFCPIHGRNATHTLMYKCYNDIFLNCSRSEKAACKQSLGQPIEMKCVKDDIASDEGPSHYTTDTGFNPQNPEWTRWIGLIAICLIMILCAALVILSCWKDIFYQD